GPGAGVDWLHRYGDAERLLDLARRPLPEVVPMVGQQGEPWAGRVQRRELVPVAGQWDVRDPGAHRPGPRVRVVELLPGVGVRVDRRGPVDRAELDGRVIEGRHQVIPGE